MKDDCVRSTSFSNNSIIFKSWSWRWRPFRNRISWTQMLHWIIASIIVEEEVKGERYTEWAVGLQPLLQSKQFSCSPQLRHLHIHTIRHYLLTPFNSFLYCEHLHLKKQWWHDLAADISNLIAAIFLWAGLHLNFNVWLCIYICIYIFSFAFILWK